MAAGAARGTGEDRPPLRLRGRAPGRRVAGRALRRARRRGADRGRAGPRHLLVAAGDRRRRWARSARSPALRGRRLLGALLGAIGAAGIADDFPPGQRRLRRPLPKRTTYNVVCELGDPEAERTVVVIAHHDSAHSGLVFHPADPADRRPPRPDREDRHQPDADGAGPRRPAPGRARGPDAAGACWPSSASSSASARSRRWPTSAPRKVVPGANDNGTAVVALLALAQRLRRGAAAGVRVILLSVGSEESFSEGIKAFGERHFPELPRESTFFLCLESIGSPHLLVAARRGLPEDARVPAARAGADRRPGRGAGHLALPQPAPAQRHRRPRAAGGRLRDRRRSAGCTDLKQPPTTTGPTTSPRTSTSAPSTTASASARRRSAASATAGSERRRLQPSHPLLLQRSRVAEFRLRARISAL